MSRLWEQKGVRVAVRKKQPVVDGYGVTSTPDGFLVGDVLLEIDVEAILAHLGPRAVKSKGRRCVALSGLVKVKAKNVKRVAA